jgi:hypothetical protein
MHIPNALSSSLAPPRLAPEAGLSIQVLPTAADRLLIASLRQYADSQSEYELDPGLAAFDKLKDELGIVMAISLNAVPIATIRFIPGGHGITLTERYWGASITEPEILGPDSWEVGRLVMAPEHRRADLLPRCMAISLEELVEHATVRHFHASCLARMTRLYRRFGFETHCVGESGAGKGCALIHAPVDRVARALKVPLHSDAAMLQ